MIQIIEMGCLKVILLDGIKCDCDKKVIVNACQLFTEYTHLGLLIGLLAKNEQQISDAIPHYSRGNDLLTEYLNDILVKDWRGTAWDEVKDEVVKLYEPYQGKRG